MGVGYWDRYQNDRKELHFQLLDFVFVFGSLFFLCFRKTISIRLKNSTSIASKFRVEKGEVREIAGKSDNYFHGANAEQRCQSRCLGLSSLNFATGSVQ